MERAWGWRAPDVRLFQWMRAGRSDLSTLLWVAIVTARWGWVPMLMVVLVISVTWPHGWDPALLALSVAGVVQWLGKRLAQHLSSPRPFSLGLCPNHLGHSSRAGFPSAHAMVMGCVWGFLAIPGPKDLHWMLLGAIALATGWARVHTGAHFPSDVVAGLALGALSGALVAVFVCASLN